MSGSGLCLFAGTALCCLPCFDKSSQRSLQEWQASMMTRVIAVWEAAEALPVLDEEACPSLWEVSHLMSLGCMLRRSLSTQQLEMLVEAATVVPTSNRVLDAETKEVDNRMLVQMWTSGLTEPNTAWLGSRHFRTGATLELVRPWLAAAEGSGEAGYLVHLMTLVVRLYVSCYVHERNRTAGMKAWLLRRKPDETWLHWLRQQTGFLKEAQNLKAGAETETKDDASGSEAQRAFIDSLQELQGGLREHPIVVLLGQHGAGLSTFAQQLVSSPARVGIDFLPHVCMPVRPDREICSPVIAMVMPPVIVPLAMSAGLSGCFMSVATGAVIVLDVSSAAHVFGKALVNSLLSQHRACPQRILIVVNKVDQLLYTCCKQAIAGTFDESAGVSASVAEWFATTTKEDALRCISTACQSAAKTLDATFAGLLTADTCSLDITLRCSILSPALFHAWAGLHAPALIEGLATQDERFTIWDVAQLYSFAFACYRK